MVLATIGHKPSPRPAPFRLAELIAMLGTAAVVDAALWANDGQLGTLRVGGFGLALVFAGVPLALVLAARAVRRSTRLSVLGLLLALVVLREAFAPSFGTTLVGLVLLSAFTLTMRVRRAFVPETLFASVAAFGALPSRIGAAVRGAQRRLGGKRLERATVLPILVPLALSVVFLGVFALANPVVAHGVDRAWTWVTDYIALPSFGRIVTAVFALVGACSLLRPVCKTARAPEFDPPTTDASATNLLVTRNALACLNLLFAGYNLLDAAYLWSGSPPAGVTTQQYAHQGAFWLTIALLLLTVVVSYMFKGPLAADPHARLQRRLAYAWMAQGALLGLGTYRRIAIHVAFSGMSDKRIVGILGTTLVLVGMARVAQKLAEKRTFGWLVRRQLDAFALMTIVWTVAPTHWISAHVNVARIESGEYRPVVHAFRQAHEAESAAVLLPLLEHPDVRIRQGVAALLETERDRLRDETELQTSWREKDLTSRRTLTALEEATPKLTRILGHVNRGSATQVLLQISHVANDGDLDALRSIPTAEHVRADASSEDDLR